MKKIYIIFLVIFILIFLIFYYKKSKLGNNIINLNEEKIIENILSNNFKYEAKVEIKVYSNKNENKYFLKIKEDDEEFLIDEIDGKEDISGLRIEKKNEDLLIKNGKLKLEKIYEDYKEFTDNSLFLNSFSKEYNETNEKEEIETNNGFIIKIKLKNYNSYIKYKELYLDKTGKPIKLIIKDSSKQPKICIKYNSVKIL